MSAGVMTFWKPYLAGAVRNSLYRKGTGTVGLLVENGAALLVVGPRHQDSLLPQAIRPLEQLLEGRV